MRPYSTPVRLLTLSLGVLLVVTGCASLPGASSPRVVDEYAPSDPATTVPTPVPDQEPDLLVRDFLEASAVSDQRHLAARQFLTERAAQNWDSTESTTIVLRADLSSVGGRTEDSATYNIRAEQVGSLDSGGIYQVEEEQVDFQIELVRVNGQWRIDDLPDGVVFERTDFFSNYARRSLYFLDPRGENVVPDPRWTSSFNEDLAYTLVNMLGDGASDDLSAGVTSRVPDTVTARPPEAESEAPGETIDFQGLPALGTRETMEFAAQVVWTLAQAEIPGPYRLERDGTPIDERFADGWSTDDVEQLAPDVNREPMELALTSSDGIVEVSANGPSPADSGWSDVRSGRSGALSRGGAELAVVTAPEDATEHFGDASSLLVGPREGGPRAVFTAGSLTRPTWGTADNVVWTVADGDEIVRLDVSGPDPDPSTIQLDQNELFGAPITDFRVSPSGVRAALTAGGRVFVTTLSEEDGAWSVGRMREIGPSLDTSVITVAWLDSSTVVVGRDSSNAPVVSISLDGGQVEPMSYRNIGPPVSSIAASGPHIYAVDSRSLLRLDVTADLSERYWRDVPGLTAIRAEPVVEG